MPSISVIVPVYKVEQYLRCCADSILAQSFSDFELILVDDGSPDGSGAICDEYAAKDSRVHVIHQPNGGLSAARNAGLDWIFAHSDSQWLAFVDSDDWVSEDYLSRMLENAERTKAQLCLCECAMEYETDARKLDFTRKIQAGVLSSREALEERDLIFNWHYVIACSKLYRKELFQDLRFPVGFVHEDEAVMHRVFHEAKTLCCIEDPLYHYRIRGNSITNNKLSPGKLDYFWALADRACFAKRADYPRLLERTLKMYHFCFWQLYRPLLRRGGADALHLKRSSRATRKILPFVFRSDVYTRGQKARLLLFSLSYKLYQRVFP